MGFERNRKNKRKTEKKKKEKDKRKKENPICMLCPVILVQFYCLVKGSREESQKGKEKKGVRVDNK